MFSTLVQVIGCMARGGRLWWRPADHADGGSIIMLVWLFWYHIFWADALDAGNYNVINYDKPWPSIFQWFLCCCAALHCTACSALSCIDCVMFSICCIYIHGRVCERAWVHPFGGSVTFACVHQISTVCVVLAWIVSVCSHAWQSFLIRAVLSHVHSFCFDRICNFKHVHVAGVCEKLLVAPHCWFGV